LLLVVENTPDLESRSERIAQDVDTFLAMTLGGLCIERESGKAVDPPTRPDDTPPLAGCDGSCCPARPVSPRSLSFLLCFVMAWLL
jgi:hypothetical protein